MIVKAFPVGTRVSVWINSTHMNVNVDPASQADSVKLVSFCLLPFEFVVDKLYSVINIVNSTDMLMDNPTE